MQKLDAVQIWKKVYDAIADAVKVKIVSTNLAIELDHTDGDSVESHPAKLVAASMGVTAPTDNGTDIIPALDCSSLREVRVDINGTGNLDIMVSPSDSGSYFYSVGGAGSIIPICARRIKVVSITVNGDVYLVGRS